MRNLQAANKGGQAGGLQVLCFPCNQFGKQEPKGPEEITAFVDNLLGKDHGLMLMEKVDVNG